MAQAPFQIKRGSLEKVQAYVAAQGEPIYSTTTYQLFVGDGVTPGGVLVSGGGGGTGGNLDFGSILVPVGFTLDLGAIA